LLSDVLKQEKEMHSNAADKHANESEAYLIPEHLRLNQRSKQVDEVNQKKGDYFVHDFKSVDQLFLKRLEQNYVAC
jgi:hypothetical protein